MEGTPPVSCTCLTYARPALLEEAIYSFLQQDYKGQKELIVLNDYDQQLLKFDHPEVQVINVPKRFRTIGEKRNAAVALCSHDLIFVWDDDDIHLPHRISFSVKHFDRRQDFFRADKNWLWSNGQLVSIAPGSPSAHCWSRSLFNQIRGYAPMGSGQDREIQRRFEKEQPGSTKLFPILPQDSFYICRKVGTGSYHLSLLARGRRNSARNAGHNEVEAYVTHQAERGRIKQGLINLCPHWKKDYPKQVGDYLKSNQLDK